MSARETVMVEASTEFLARMGEWSPPLQVKYEQRGDGTHEFQFRALTPDAVPQAVVEAAMKAAREKLARNALLGAEEYSRTTIAAALTAWAQHAEGTRDG